MNEPAFPRTGNFSQDQESVFDSTTQDGMSLRDYFASAALPALLDEVTVLKPEQVAGKAYELADAMLAERAKNQS